MPDYSIKLYDDEIMSFRAEKHYDEISIEVLSVTESMRHLFLTTCIQIATVFFTGFAGV